MYDNIELQNEIKLVGLSEALRNIDPMEIQDLNIRKHWEIMQVSLFELDTILELD